MFDCEKCGACCTNLNKFSGLYEDLDDGHGCCIYFDFESHLCKIYEARPDKCDVLKSYSLFRNVVTFQEYIEITKEGCNRLRRGFK